MSLLRESRHELPSPVAVPVFRRLLLGHVLLTTADQMTPVAVAAVLLVRGGTATEFGVILAARYAALAGCALLGGVWADRLPRGQVLLGAGLLRLLAITGITAAVLTGHTAALVFAALLLLVGAAEAVSQPAMAALLPGLVTSRDLPRANALLGAAYQAALICGPGLAAGLLLVGDPAAALLAAGSAVVAGALAWLRLPEPPRPAPAERDLRREIAEGVRTVRERPWISAVLAASSLQLALVIAPATVLLPVLLAESSAGPSAYAWVAATGAVGGLAGALLAGRRQAARPGRSGLLLTTGWALPPLALALGAPVPILAAAWLLAAATAAPFDIWWDTALQRDVPPGRLARVVALDWTCSLTLFPVGLALTGTAIEHLGVTTVLTVTALLALPTAVLPLLVPGVSDLRSTDTGSATGSRNAQ